MEINVEEVTDILSDIGLPVKSIKKIFHKTKKEDYVLDVEMTPNRKDAMSHYGIARDLYVVLKFRGKKVYLQKPPIIENNSKNYYHNNEYQINILENKKCIRYSGISICKIKIEASPNWLVDRLKSIGIKSTNNIIDIIKFVTHELGQPIHVFDMDQIEENKIIIKNAEKNIEIQSSDHIIRKFDKEDLMIYDLEKPLSIAGIINNIISSIHINTKNIFLGSACFDPFIIRIIGNKYLIQTEEKYLMERGMDPTQTVYALQRAAFLINKITNKRRKIYSSNIIDVYPNPIYPPIIKLRYKKIINIIGKKISQKKIKNILSLLEISIHSENRKYLCVIVPLYRIDVKREIDLIEEILRIYNINKIDKISEQVKISPLPYFFYKTEHKIKKILFEQLINYGFQEIISYTIRNKDQFSFLLNSFYQREEIKILNPINQNYKFMRSSLLFGILDCIKYNYNRKNTNVKLFEIGKIYYKENNKFLEKTYLGIAIGMTKEKKIVESTNSYFFYLKGIIEQIFQKSGIYNYTQQVCYLHPLLENSISILYNNKILVELGKLKNNFLKKKEIFYAEIDWKYLISIIKNKKIIYVPFSKYPTSRRDLSLLVDKSISFERINQLLIKEKKNHMIKKIKIYDYYKGKNIPISKISYTVSFFFESKKETLSDKIINHSMKKIESFLTKKLKAKVRDSLIQ
ncbi:phenylalanine--tRNA ligase subunit beta [Blattabacterium cuenoti]|uniref:phenylalanine--tRNA ligase subunit beta n=1 Tax=Blattabacterium cuenoti TaxID=1653831 RepID=UPI001EECAA36|nr:phenylalanine--tRNA ligase subunit beta [Blattabacterium cuenoti]